MSDQNDAVGEHIVHSCQRKCQLRGFSRLPTMLRGSSGSAERCRRSLHIVGQQQPPNYDYLKAEKKVMLDFESNFLSYLFYSHFRIRVTRRENI